MPCYQCGTRQLDPEPGKPSPWHRGVVREHQVLICPECYPAALSAAELARCSRCDSVRLVRRLDQVECLNCQLARDVLPDADDLAADDLAAEDPAAEDSAADDAAAEDSADAAAADPPVPAPRGQDSGLAAEVASALARVLGTAT